MNDEEIVEFARKLRAETSKSNRVIEFMRMEVPDSYHVVATRPGFLNMASLFLLAAVESQKDDSLDVDIVLERSIYAASSDVVIESFERNDNFWKIEDFPREKTFKEKAKNTACLSGCVLRAMCIVTLIAVGLFTVASALFNYLFQTPS